MKRKHKIKPDFTIDNINDINNDPGARHALTGPTTALRSLAFSANTNSHLTAPDNDDFTFHDGTDDYPFTIAFWANLTADGSDTNTRYLFGKYPTEYIAYYKRSTGQISLNLYDTSQDGGGTGVTTFTTAATFGGGMLLSTAFDTWTHIAMVYTPETSDDNNTEQVRFYKNGSPWMATQGTSNVNYDSMQNEANKFVIGDATGWVGAPNRTIGSMSNFLMFKHDGQNNDAGTARSSVPMTDAEIEELYNLGQVMADYNNHSKGADLVGYWKMQEDVSSASEITDYSPQSNHMTVIGSAVTTTDTDTALVREKVILGPAPPQLPLRVVIPGLSSLRTNPQK